MSFSFGRFAGVPLEQVDEAYLLMMSGKRLWKDLAEAIEKELERRALARRGLRKAA